MRSFVRGSLCPVIWPGPANQLRNKRKSSIINHFAIHRANDCTFSGVSANAGPHDQKLYARVTHIWGNRKGQPDRSAMKGPRLERTASLITLPPVSGKFFVFKVDGQAPLREVQCPPTDSLIQSEDTVQVQR